MIKKTGQDVGKAAKDSFPLEEAKPRGLYTILAGTDPVAVDACAVELARWNNRKLSGKNIPHIAAAYRKGLGELNLEKLIVLKLEC